MRYTLYIIHKICFMTTDIYFHVNVDTCFCIHVCFAFLPQCLLSSLLKSKFDLPTNTCESHYSQIQIRHTTIVTWFKGTGKFDLVMNQMSFTFIVISFHLIIVQRNCWKSSIFSVLTLQINIRLIKMFTKSQF